MTIQKAYLPDGRSFPTYWEPKRLHIGFQWRSHGAAVLLGKYNDVLVELTEMSEDKTEVWVDIIK